MTAKKQKSVVEPTAQITFVPISDLTKYARNARTHSPEQIAQIAASIMRFGWTSPELADETGTLIAGHGRVMAAEILYAKGSALRMASGVPIPAGTVPVMYALGWTKAERAAYVIADNKLALNAGWDDALLRMEFVDLKAEGFDLGLTGFADLELTALFGAPLAGGANQGPNIGSLAERFMVVPFSVLNAREGWWQDRKRAWLALGIQSDLGRGDTAVNSPHEGHGMADGHEAVRARQKGSRKPDAMPGGGGGLTALSDAVTNKRPNATPGGSLMPASDYSKRQRGDGKGRAVG